MKEKHFSIFYKNQKHSLISIDNLNQNKPTRL